MITSIALGVGLGIGLWALAVYLFPPQPALGVVLARAT
ncbi:MAG: secretion system protein, partial [Saccharothrix sp.]|nr:secretion system protein [Saccharothrix sp.]